MVDEIFWPGANVHKVAEVVKVYLDSCGSVAEGESCLKEEWQRRGPVRRDLNAEGWGAEGLRHSASSPVGRPASNVSGCYSLAGSSVGGVSPIVGGEACEPDRSGGRGRGGVRRGVMGV